MRRPLLALALLAGALTGAVLPGATGGNDVASSTAVFRATTVTGASLISLDYTLAGSSITAVEPRLRGVGLLDLAVTAQFDGGTQVVCTRLSLDVFDLLTDLQEGTYSCTGLLASADRPPRLQITAG